MLTDPAIGRARREVRTAKADFQAVSDKFGRGEASLKEFDAARAVLGRCQADLADHLRGTAAR